MKATRNQFSRSSTFWFGDGSLLLILLLQMSGCSDNFMSKKSTSKTTISQQLAATQDSAGNYTAALDPNSSSTQLLRASTGAVAGSAIAFPPGALSIPVTVTIGEGESLTSNAVVSQLGLDSNGASSAGPAVNFAASSNVEASSPFTLSIPISGRSSLALDGAAGDINSDNLVVMYKWIVVENGVTNYAVGLIPKKDLTISSTGAQFQTTRFGTFQLVVTKTKVTETITKPIADAPVLKVDPVRPRRVEAPVFSLASGSYTSSQSLALSSKTFDSVIYYTIDGSTPTPASTKYSGPIAVSVTQTVKAMATRENWLDSEVASSAYVVTIAASAPASTTSTVSAPTFSPGTGSYTGTQSVTISSSTPDVTIYYTIDGSTPTTGGSQYTSAVTVAASMTIKAIAVKSLWTNSSVTTAVFTITTDTTAPTVGSFSSSSNVTESGFTLNWTAANDETTTQANLEYMLCSGASASAIDTVAECESATVEMGYTSGVTSRVIAGKTANTTYFYNVVVRDAAGNKAIYAVKSETTTTASSVVMPSFSVSAGTYTSTQSVAISTTTAGASIYYTTDGSTPSISSSLYASAISVSISQTIKAIAIRAGFTDSSVASAAYQILPLMSYAAGAVTPEQPGLTRRPQITLSVVSGYTTNTLDVYYSATNSTPCTGTSVLSSPLGAGPTISVTELPIAVDLPPTGVAYLSAKVSGTTGAVTETSSCSALGQYQTGISKVAVASIPYVPYAGWGCAIVNGTLKCWGANAKGQLGNGSTSSSTTPVIPGSLYSGVTDVAMSVDFNSPGNAATCAVADGFVWCFGDNTYGQLGNGTMNSSFYPVQVLQAGSTPLTDVESIQGSTGSFCAVTGSHDLYCWGRNVYGQVGNNTTSDLPFASPVMISGNSLQVSQVTMGNGNVCAGTLTGALYCWGFNSYGKLGEGTQDNQYTPTMVSGFESGVGKVSADETATCATKGTSLYCWGKNDSWGQLGNNSTSTFESPQLVSNVSNPIDVLAGKSSYAFSAFGSGTAASTFWSWGYNAYKQLFLTSGNLTVDQWEPASPTLPSISGDTIYRYGSSKASGSSDVVCFGTSSGVHCRGGYTTAAAPGIGSDTGAALFYSNIGGSFMATDVAASKNVSCSVLDYTAVYCWGKNNLGQLGNGTTTDSSTPVQVMGL